MAPYEIARIIGLTVMIVVLGQIAQTDWGRKVYRFAFRKPVTWYICGALLIGLLNLRF